MRTVRQIKLLTVGLLAFSATVFGAGIARADGYLTPGEEAVGDAISSDLCSYIDNNGVTRSSLTVMFRAIYPMPEIASGGDVADVINYVVDNYCPEHWRELVAFGSAARGT